VFHPLGKEHLVRIINLLMIELNKQLLDQDIAVELSDEVVEFLIKNDYQPMYGARPMRRAIQKYIEDPLSEEILKGRFKDAKKISVLLENNTPVFIEDEVAVLV
ncbi:MAG: ATP-dependent Clp protease ATP-binding subunit ClpC, partial [Nitrospirota bacterium]